MADELLTDIKGLLEHYFSEQLGEGACDDIAEEILAKVHRHEGYIDCPECGGSGLRQSSRTTNIVIHNCSNCNGTGKVKNRLDRPDREKIAKTIFFHGEGEDTNKWNCLRPNQKEMYYKIADQILALIPDEEEIRKQIISWIEKHKAKEPAFHTFNAKGVEDCILIKVKDWQALKEGK